MLYEVITTTTKQLQEEIEALNKNPNVHGILLQHPVPPQIDERSCFDAIDISKDVDGVTCLGFGKMAMGEEAYGCATPKGIMRLLEAYDIPLEGKNAAVVVITSYSIHYTKLYEVTPGTAVPRNHHGTSWSSPRRYQHG